MRDQVATFIDQFGEIVSHLDFEDEEIIAVTMVRHGRKSKWLAIIRIGATGTGEGSTESAPIWSYSDVKQSSPMLFKLLQELPREIEKRKLDRVKQGKSTMRWEANVRTIGFHLVEDDDLLSSLIEEDWDWLFHQYE